MNGRHTRWHLIAASLLLACAPLALAAKDAPQSQMKPMNQQTMPMNQQNMPMRPNMHRKGMRHHGMMGVHNMPGTVTSVDHHTGIVRLDSLGMHLVVHFPPPTIKDLKAGDKISLHLGYRITSQ